MLADQSYKLSPCARQALSEYIPIRMELSHFANARSIRNALDRARLRQANRLFASREKELKKEDLITLTEEDFRASRVFLDGKLDGDPADGIMNDMNFDEK
jgi:hypothetical protein